MNTRARLIGCALLLTAACAGVGPDAPTSLPEAQAAAAARGVPILLDFYTDW